MLSAYPTNQCIAQWVPVVSITVNNVSTRSLDRKKPTLSGLQTSSSHVLLVPSGSRVCAGGGALFGESDGNGLSLPDRMALARGSWQACIAEPGPPVHARNQRHEIRSPPGAFSHNIGSTYDSLDSPYQGLGSGREAIGVTPSVSQEQAWLAKAREQRSHMLRSTPHVRPDGVQWKRSNTQAQRLSAQDLRDFLQKNRVGPLAAEQALSHARLPHRALSSKAVRDGVHLRPNPASSSSRRAQSAALQSLDYPNPPAYHIHRNTHQSKPLYRPSQYKQGQGHGDRLPGAQMQLPEQFPGRDFADSPKRPKSLYNDHQKTAMRSPPKSKSVQGGQSSFASPRQRLTEGRLASPFEEPLRRQEGGQDDKSNQHTLQRHQGHPRVLSHQMAPMQPQDSPAYSSRGRYSIHTQPVAYEQSHISLPHINFDSSVLDQQPGPGQRVQYSPLHSQPLAPVQPMVELDSRSRKKHRSRELISEYPPLQSLSTSRTGPPQEAAAKTESSTSQHSEPLGNKDTHADESGSSKLSMPADTGNLEVVYEVQQEDDLTELQPMTLVTRSFPALSLEKRKSLERRKSRRTEVLQQVCPVLLGLSPLPESSLVCHYCKKRKTSTIASHLPRRQADL